MEWRNEFFEIFSCNPTQNSLLWDFDVIKEILPLLFVSIWFLEKKKSILWRLLQKRKEWIFHIFLSFEQGNSLHRCQMAPLSLLCCCLVLILSISFLLVSLCLVDIDWNLSKVKVKSRYSNFALFLIVYNSLYSSLQWHLTWKLQITWLARSTSKLYLTGKFNLAIEDNSSFTPKILEYR